MQEVCNWILSHYEVLITGLTFVLSIIILLCRKKPVNSLLGVIYSACVEAVLNIESSSILGAEAKLNAALDLVNDHLRITYPDLDIKSYRKLIVSIIEDILSTPHKKEVK